ncbi:MAG: hypothetical protein EHM14_10210 [Methanothrix sp.]|nr:MAG: hypothetical protein EHM14_10210 [Methanothrix sp.]
MIDDNVDKKTEAEKARSMVTELDVNELIDKTEKVTKQREMDLSTDADLSIGIMNLINLEEHLFFTAEETGKDEYFDLLKEVRKMRIELLEKIIKESEGEVWCISKHLLTASMRFMETGTKLLGEGNNEEAKSLFEKSYRLYLLFWEINSRTIYPRIVSEEEADKGKLEGKAPTQEENQKNEKIVFVPVCKESL